MRINYALLGFGASGTWLALVSPRPGRIRTDWNRWLTCILALTIQILFFSAKFFAFTG